MDLQRQNEIIKQEMTALCALLTGSPTFTAFYQPERYLNDVINSPIGWIADPSLAPGINGLLRTAVHPDHSVTFTIHLREIPIPLADDLLTAHEMLHIRLHFEGFPTVWRLDSPPGAIDAALSSMLTDRIIDARLATYGFDVRSHFERHVAQRREALEAIPHEPTSPADRILWIVNHVGFLLEAQRAGSPFDGYLAWFAARYPKIDRDARRWARQIRAIGYAKPAQHRQILTLIGKEYGLFKKHGSRIMDLREAWDYARRKDRAVSMASDGVTWSTETQITAHYQGNVAAVTTVAPSNHTAGSAYISAYTATGTGAGAAAAIYSTPDYGANWSQVVTPAGFTLIDWEASCLHIPFNDNPADGIVYFSTYDYGQPAGAKEILKRKNADGSISTIPITYNGDNYLPLERLRGFAIAPTNRQRIVCSAFSSNFGGTGIFKSEDGGNTWSMVIAPAVSPVYLYAAIDGSNPSIVYLWGVNGSIAYSTDFLASYDERGPGGAGTMVGITGN